MADGVTRRAVLSGAGALSLAGCLGDVGRPGAPERTTVDRTPTVSFAAAVLRSFADEHPAGLRLALSNDGDEPLVVRWNTSDGQGGPFNAVWGVQRDGDAEVGVFRRDGAAALCVPGDDSPVPESPVDGCWAPPCESVDLPSLHGRFELSPDEPNTDEYVVLDGPGGECLGPGTYVFDGDRAGIGASVARGEVVDASAETESRWHPLRRRLALSIDEGGDVTATAEAAVAPPDTPEGDGSTTGTTPQPVARLDRPGT